jgi:simple sugar transport system permease protein
LTGLLNFRRRVTSLHEIGAFVSLFVVFGTFSLLSPYFLTSANLAGIASIAAELGVVAVGVCLLMVAGEFDLSVGSTFGLGAWLAATLLVTSNNPFLNLLTLIFVLGMCGCIGLLNGILTVKLGLPSFIITLGTSMFIRGILYAISSGLVRIYTGSMFVPDILNGLLVLDFRTSLVWLVATVILAQVTLTRGKWGNWTLATGGKKDAARAMGVDTSRVKIVNFVICAFLAGLGGCISFSRMKSIQALLGQGLELEAIAATVIGGTLLTGGYGSVVGTLAGTFITASVRSGLVLAGAPPYWYSAFIGIILILATMINYVILHRRMG